ncbi:succinate dehydrogenase subunit 4, mitochondrial-like [Iris pallida]|uniref:Succinate dehydrogenase subunit 4, mitochondrial-like n=1 Tax=Iris pallida TaxID=29817 RepID=A0AAX6FR47_IRIPA|nr:succinate dehydrogenase subunit 4, mitochondrial-like [Iris pallida]
MASRLLSRSKTLTLTRSLLLRSSTSSSSSSHVFDPIAAPAAAVAATHFHHPIHSSSSVAGNLSTPPSDRRSPTSGAVHSPAVSSLLHSQMELSKKVVGTEHKGAVGCDHLKEKEVACFSPLEASATNRRSSILQAESLKLKRTEQSINITYALIPPLLLVAKTPLTTSLLIFAVYWQIYGFFKEIFLDYVHQEVTRKWVLVYFKVLLLILAKDTIINFGLF